MYISEHQPHAMMPTQLAFEGAENTILGTTCHSKTQACKTESLFLNVLVRGFPALYKAVRALLQKALARPSSFKQLWCIFFFSKFQGLVWHGPNMWESITLDRSICPHLHLVDNLSDDQGKIMLESFSFRYHPSNIGTSARPILFEGFQVSYLPVPSNTELLSFVRYRG
ncbi:hypothetical protein BDZ94DRAFT_105364 [Collybia nuda]|uniref:Uncharacterized protein n=1 Tax=Collybia nuda TaxID=64659 RepID=A0A9P5XXB8_9AGAR|nr:hypothetical protein BDZ94DRAFT_105364 [Collybia nuda]